MTKDLKLTIMKAQNGSKEAMSKLLDENVQIGVSGGTSSGMKIKSLKIKSILKNFKLKLYENNEYSNNSQETIFP